jgi:hypothetical protein
MKQAASRTELADCIMLVSFMGFSSTPEDGGKIFL